MQICLPDNSDNTWLQKLVQHRSFHHAHTRASTLCRITVCWPVCVCWAMTLIGKRISVLWLSAWSYQICARTCVLPEHVTPGKRKQTRDSEPPPAHPHPHPHPQLGWLWSIQMMHVCAGRTRATSLQSCSVSGTFQHSSGLSFFIQSPRNEPPPPQTGAETGALYRRRAELRLWLQT